MQARVTPLRMRPDRIEQSIAFIHGEVVPTFRQLRGFRGALWLHDPARNVMLAINLWATPADLERGDPARFGWVERTSRLVTAPPEPRIYEVRREDRLLGIWDEPGRHARVHQAEIIPERHSEALDLARERLVVPGPLEPEYLGHLLLTSVERDRLLSVSFWASAEAAGDVEGIQPGIDTTRRLTDILTAPLDAGIYAVTANG